MESIREAGQTLVEAGHYASETIQACLTDIGELWNELDSKMKYKGKWAEHMGWALDNAKAGHVQVTCKSHARCDHVVQVRSCVRPANSSSSTAKWMTSTCG